MVDGSFVRISRLQKVPPCVPEAKSLQKTTFSLLFWRTADYYSRCCW